MALTLKGSKKIRPLQGRTNFGGQVPWALPTAINSVPSGDNSSTRWGCGLSFGIKERSLNNSSAHTMSHSFDRNLELQPPCRVL